MSTDAVFESYLKAFAKTRATEVSETPKINFVSTDIAIAFWEEGKKIGEQEFKKRLKEAAIKKFESQLTCTLDVVKQISNVFKEKKFVANKVFLAINIDVSKILVTIPENQHYSKEFMNLFYPLASELEDTYSEFQLYVSAIDESDKLNMNLLKSDGYTFGFDLANEKKLSF